MTIGIVNERIETHELIKRNKKEAMQQLYKIIIAETTERNNCSHDLVLNLGKDGRNRRVGPCNLFVCPICGRQYFLPEIDTEYYTNFPFKNSKVLDFSENPISLDMQNGEFIIQIAIKTILKQGTENNPDMSVEEFIKTIPQELYTNPEAVKEILKEKVKEKD